MLRAVQSGLVLADFEHLTAGMILDYIITASNDSIEDDARTAAQDDYDRF